MKYTITIKKQALKDLALLPKDAVIRISTEIESLSDNPRPAGCKKLKGSQNELWRIRVGNYRVIYMVDDVVYIVNIQSIGHRKDIYDK